MSQDRSPRKPGRPRSTEARNKALKAAQEILLRDGFGRLTIEAVAAASGTGKPTIYRNWANAQELTMEALITDIDGEDMPDTNASPRAALMRQLDRLIRAFASTRGRQITLALASADPDSEFTRAFRNRVILKNRDAGRDLIKRFIAEAKLAEPPDLEILLDMIYGPLFFRLLTGHQPLDKSMPAVLVDTAFAALKGR